MKGSTMGVYMNSKISFALFFLIFLTWLACSDAVACDSCGRECANACGTKHFRTCCFNYLRKRSYPNEPETSENIPDNNSFGLSTLDQKLENWIHAARDIQNDIHHVSTSTKAVLSKKGLLIENIPDYP